MKFTKIENGYTIRLQQGEQVLQTLFNFCKKERVTSAYLGGIGAFENAELGFYHLDRKEYEWRKFETPMEVVSLTGNVSISEAVPFLHIHCVLSNENFETVGGHLKEATVGATLEVFLTQIETPLMRTRDEETGLKLLELES